MKLLMITGDRSLSQGKRGAFYNTLEEFHKYWERIDIIAPKTVGDVGNVGGEQFHQAKRSIKRSDPTTRTVNLFGNVYVHVSPWPLFLQPFWIFKKGLEIYKEQKFNLVTVHSYPPFYNDIGARMLWKKIRVPYVLEIHHIPGYPKAANLKERVYRGLMRLFVKFDSAKAKAVRVVNQKQTPEFLIKAGVPKEKIVYIPSMYIDLDIFKPMDVDKEYDLIFVGRLAENKGISLFLEAVKKLNSKAIIIGDGPLLRKYKIQYTKYNIQFYGWAKDSHEVAELINRSKILVMPSYNEGGPRVVLEAMACGVPVLATNVGLVPDLAVKGGVRIIDWNVEDIAQKTKELLENESERKKLSQAGLEISKQFEKKEMIKYYAEKLREFVKR